MVTQETRDYVRGLYGRSPAPIDPKIQKQILGKDKPITCRPADLLKPGLPGCVDSVDPKLLKGEEDIRRIGHGTLLIADSQGLQFRVADLLALDRHSKRLLERFL